MSEIEVLQQSFMQSMESMQKTFEKEKKDLENKILDLTKENKSLKNKNQELEKLLDISKNVETKELAKKYMMIQNEN